MRRQGGEEKELGEQLKTHRQRAQMSQEELADHIYVSRQTISNWENNKTYPDVNSLVLLSAVFQVSLDKLIKGDIDAMKNEALWEDLYRIADCYSCVSCAVIQEA